MTAADASLKITTGNPGLEHFDTDGGVQLDFGLTDQNGNPVGNLRPDNVKVFEDGKEAKILDFRGVGQGRPVDIVFVLDVTESMQPYIDAVKQNVIAFAQDLQSNSRDYRLGLVTFEDYVVSAYPDCNCAYRNSFTSDVKQFTEWVGTLHAGGGGDIPEDQLDALAYAAKFPFRPEAEGIIIIVTDAPSHHDGDGSADTAHDQAFWDHHTRGVQVTDLTGHQSRRPAQEEWAHAVWGGSAAVHRARVPGNRRCDARPFVQYHHGRKPLPVAGARNRPFDRDGVFADLSNAAAD